MAFSYQDWMMFFDVLSHDGNIVGVTYFTLAHTREFPANCFRSYGNGSGSITCIFAVLSLGNGEVRTNGAPK